MYPMKRNIHIPIALILTGLAWIVVLLAAPAVQAEPEPTFTPTPTVTPTHTPTPTPTGCWAKVTLPDEDPWPEKVVIPQSTSHIIMSKEAGDVEKWRVNLRLTLHKGLHVIQDSYGYGDIILSDGQTVASKTLVMQGNGRELENNKQYSVTIHEPVYVLLTDPPGNAIKCYPSDSYSFYIDPNAQ